MVSALKELLCTPGERHTDNHPTSEVNALLLVGTQGRKPVVLEELEHLSQMRFLTVEFIPQKIYQKEMGKVLESTLTQICRLTRWFSWLLEMTSNMVIRKIEKDVWC